ncbi:MAG: hypothetical protein HFI91_12070 [Lachnospiraceae bacterium]|jgi:FlaA1/EpsC-like NDP-sugar epimerase|nr:hypothetical protein [Lachnospiraceae bacterium]
MNKATPNWEEERETLIFQRERNREQFHCVLQWLDLLEEGTNLAPYLKDHRCRRVAIYGAARIGEMLLKEIRQYEQWEVEPVYFLDQSGKWLREKWGIPVYLPEEFPDLPEVDMVIVTAISYFASVRDQLFLLRPEIPVVSLNTMIEVRKDEVWYEKR